MIDVASPADLSDELIRRYSEDCEIKGISPDTLRRYLSSVKIFNQYLKTKGGDFLDVNKDILRDFLGYLRKDRQVCHKTIENYFTSIASFYDYMYLIMDDLGLVDIESVYNHQMKEIRKRVGAIAESVPYVSETVKRPSIDVKETDEAIIVTMELPGVGKDDVDVEIIGDELSVIAKRSANLRLMMRRSINVNEITIPSRDLSACPRMSNQKRPKLYYAMVY